MSSKKVKDLSATVIQDSVIVTPQMQIEDDLFFVDNALRSRA